MNAKAHRFINNRPVIHNKLLSLELFIAWESVITPETMALEAEILYLVVRKASRLRQTHSLSLTHSNPFSDGMSTDRFSLIMIYKLCYTERTTDVRPTVINFPIKEIRILKLNEGRHQKEIPKKKRRLSEASRLQRADIVCLPGEVRPMLCATVGNYSGQKLLL